MPRGRAPWLIIVQRNVKEDDVIFICGAREPIGAEPVPIAMAVENTRKNRGIAPSLHIM
jgi:hypothetical protein